MAQARPRPVLLARSLGTARERARGGSTALVVAVNIAWPRSAVYDSLAGTKDSAGHVIPGHWYWQYIAILFIGIVVIVGALYYFAVYSRKPIEVLA